MSSGYSDMVLMKTKYYKQFTGDPIPTPFADRVYASFIGKLEEQFREGFGMPEAVVTFHSNGEIAVKIEGNVRNKQVFLVHDYIGRDGNYDPVYGSQTAELIADAIKRASGRDLTLITPHLPYSRQDRKDEGRVPISAKNFADKIQASGVQRLVTADLHATQIQGFYNIPVDNLSPYHSFLRHLGGLTEDGLPLLEGGVGVACLDLGGTKRIKPFTKKLARYRQNRGKKEYIPTIIVDKYRPKAGESDVANVIGNPSGLALIAVEDMIDGGGTVCGGAGALLRPSQFLDEKSLAKSLYVCATLGLFSPKYVRDEGRLPAEVLGDDSMMARFREQGGILVPAEINLRKSGAKVVITDTLPHSREYLERNNDWLTEVSIANLVAEAIYQIYTQGSVSAVLENHDF